MGLLLAAKLRSLSKLTVRLSHFYDPKKEFLCYYDGDGWVLGGREGEREV